MIETKTQLYVKILKLEGRIDELEAICDRLNADCNMLIIRMAKTMENSKKSLIAYKAINAENREIQNKRFGLATENERLKVEVTELQAQLAEYEKKRSKGTCLCMDCGKTIKTVDQSKHDKECKKKAILPLPSPKKEVKK